MISIDKACETFSEMFTTICPEMFGYGIAAKEWENEFRKRLEKNAVENIQDFDNLNEDDIDNWTSEVGSISKEEILKIGFIENGEWANREYFTKDGFDIVLHNGSVHQCDDDSWSGYGKRYTNINELNNAYWLWLIRELSSFKSKMIAIHDGVKQFREDIKEK